jgi:uncharacterized membrane protein
LLQILELNGLKFTERLVTVVGLSIGFLMLYGYFADKLLFSLGYWYPLSEKCLVLSFSFIMIILFFIGYNKNEILFFPVTLNMEKIEKVFLIPLIYFPTLSVFGVFIMNKYNNNIILMILIFLVSLYVISICFFGNKIPERIYPLAIFVISISIIIISPLRVKHIFGSDTHSEFYFFKDALIHLHLSIFGNSSLNACLSVTLLPTIYQLFLNLNSEKLFIFLYPLIYSLHPLIVYTISKNYLKDVYAFLASFFFISQTLFIYTETNSRTSLAIFFFGLFLMILFSDNINLSQKRILLPFFMIGGIVSHYSTTYFFFIIMFFMFVGNLTFFRKYSHQKIISLTFIILFAASIFCWYAQFTGGSATDSGLNYILKTLNTLNQFFLEESRHSSAQRIMGSSVDNLAFSDKILWLLQWLTFIYIGIGITTLVLNFKKMLFTKPGFEKKNLFMLKKIDSDFFLISILYLIGLFLMVLVPYLSVGYGMDRFFALSITVLSICFVIGGIVLGKGLMLLLNIISINCNLKILCYLPLLLLLITYFLSITGFIGNVFHEVQQTSVLNADCEFNDRLYIHDQDLLGATWFFVHKSEYLGKSENFNCLYSDYYGKRNIYLIEPLSNFDPTFSVFDQLDPINDSISLPPLKININKVNGYIYLRHTNSLLGKIYVDGPAFINIRDLNHIFENKNRIYNNGGSQIWF